MKLRDQLRLEDERKRDLLDELLRLSETRDILPSAKAEHSEAGDYYAYAYGIATCRLNLIREKIREHLNDEDKALDALIVAGIRGKRCEKLTPENLARDEESLSEEDLEALDRLGPDLGRRISRPDHEGITGEGGAKP